MLSFGEVNKLQESGQKERQEEFGTRDFHCFNPVVN
jgi:hypothetical protein